MESIRWILNQYQHDLSTAIVVVGDITDRSIKWVDSQNCLDILIQAKLETGNVFLLQTNHLMYHQIPFYPCDWWSGLSGKEYEAYTELFDLFPYAVHVNGVIACHGLPVPNLKDGNDIKIGSLDWYSLTWGRLSDAMCTRQYIDRILVSNGFNLIVHSHDHHSPIFSHNKRVITFTTSQNIPNSKRLIVEVDLTQSVESHKDVKIIDIDKEDLI